MKDWNGKEIKAAKSKGGVIVVQNPWENLIRTGFSIWPVPEIIQKLYESRQKRAFQGEQKTIATQSLGYYCDLQSIHSEDAITWSVFGPILYSSLEIRSRWTRDFLSLLKIKSPKTRKTNIFLWRRIPHPDTLVPGGPEIDFGILTEDTVVLGESKWRSKVAEKQGKKGDKRRKKYLRMHLNG